MIRRPNGMYSVFAIAFALVAATPSTAQTVVHVDADAAPGGDGSSWSKALADLQGALAAASGGTVDEIWVAEGTYRPDSGSGSRTAAFVVPRGVDLYGGFAGTEIDRSQRDPVAHATILSGDLLGDDGPDFANTAENSHHVLVFDHANLAWQQLDGFIVRSGNADGPAAEDRIGAALLARDFAYVTLVDCTFTANQSVGDGGAIHFGFACIVAVDGCDLIENRSGGNGGALHSSSSCWLTLSNSSGSDNVADGDGGAVHALDGELSILSSRFERNRSGGSGGGVFFRQQEAFGVISSFSMKGCAFEENECAFQGGGVSGRRDEVDFNLRTTIQDCSFVRNRSTDATASRGGGLDLGPSDPIWTLGHLELTRCEFLENETGGSGGGISLDRIANAILYDVVLERNEAGNEGGAIGWEDGGTLSIHNSRVVANESSRGGGIGSHGGRLELFRSLLAGNRATGNYGAAYAYGPTWIEGCTIAANHAGSAVGGVRCYRTTQKNGHASNSIFWGNSDNSGTAQISHLNGFVEADWCCIQGWDDTIEGDSSFDADPLFVDPANGNFRLGPGSPCIEISGPGFVGGGAYEDLDGYSIVTDGDFDRVLVEDLGCFEFSHVDLAATATSTPGGKVTIDTSGTAGLPLFLIFGLDQGWLFLPRVGYLGVELGSICGCLPWTPAPSSVTLDVPSDAPLVDVWVQQIAFSGAAANFSNLVKIEVR